MQKLIFGNSDKNHFTLIRIGNLTFLMSYLANSFSKKNIIVYKCCFVNNYVNLAYVLLELTLNQSQHGRKRNN